MVDLLTSSIFYNLSVHGTCGDRVSFEDKLLWEKFKFYRGVCWSRS
jgi:hypothetical protein